MSWNIEKPGDRINGPLTITGNTTLTGTATISGDLTVDTNTLKVDATNNCVGVLMAIPLYPLHVAGRISYSSAIGEGADATLSSSGTVLLHGNSATWTEQRHYIAGVERYRLSSSGATWYSAASGTQMTLDASGNLGVGVSAAGERWIKVAGSAGTFPRFISEVGAKSWETGYRSGTTSFEIREDSTTRLAVANGGQVQVGINGTASVPAIALAANLDTGLYWPTNSDTLALAVGGSDAVYIDSNRRVGIGISSSIAATLHVEGAAAQARFSTAAASDARHEYYRNGVREAYISWDLDTFQIYGTKSGGSLLLGTNSTERLRIKSTGQIRFVPLASDPGSAQSGDVYYNSTTNKLRCHNGTTWNDLF